MEANPRYWAGPPPISTIEVVTDLGGRSSVAAFEDDEVDYAPIGDYDASWIAYDETLGPQLREVPVAVGRLLRLRHAPSAVRRRPRPPGLRGRGRLAAHRPARRVRPRGRSRRPWSRPASPDGAIAMSCPSHDPDAARALLAAAGYPGGAGFPTVTLMTGGSGYDEAIVAELEDELGIEVAQEIAADGYFERLQDDPPADVEPVVGRRLPGSQRLPGRAAGDRIHQQLRPLELAGVRCRHRGGRRDDRRGRGRRGLRPGRDDRPARRPGDPGQLRHRLGAGPRRSARRRPERTRDRCGSPAWTGRDEAATAARVWSRRWPSHWRRSPWSVVRRRPAPPNRSSASRRSTPASGRASSSPSR